MVKKLCIAMNCFADRPTRSSGFQQAIILKRIQFANGKGLEVSMREWLLVLFPVALIFYFVIFPDQFSAVMDTLGGVIFKR
jgi:hypothetical protein